MAELKKVIYSIERCICHVPDACRDCGYDNEPCPKCFEHLLRDAHDLLKAQDAKWISCNDMLPKDAGYSCLVSAVSKMGGQAVFIAFTGYGDFKWHTSDKTYLSMHGGQYNTEISEAWTITHWMPLPEPPKEET